MPGFGRMSSFSLCDHPERVSDEFKQFARDNGVPLLNFKDFEVLEFLCSGSFGSCYKAKRKSDGEIVALKFFGYSQRNPVASYEDQRGVEREIEVDWHFTGFPCTAKCLGYMVDSYEGYVSNIARVPEEKDMGFGPSYPHHTGKRYKGRTVVKVSECLRAEVLDYILTMPTINEKELSRIFKNFVEGLALIHNANYIHRDLKPENIMLNENGETRLIDFGMAKAIPNGATEIRGERAGSPFYIAPETLVNLVTSKASDMFTVGTILYVMLFANHAFDKEGHNTRKCQYSIPSSAKRSANAIDLVSKLLQLNPGNRLTCEQVLLHPWITREGESEQLDQEVGRFGAEYISNIKDWSHKSKLQRIFRDKIAESIKRKRILTFAYKEKTGQHINLTVDQFNAIRDDFFKVNIEIIQRLEEESPGDLPSLTGVLGFVSSFLGGSPKSSSTNSTIKVVGNGKSSALPYDMFCEVMSRNHLQPFATNEIFNVFDLDSSGKVDYVELMLNLASLRVDNKSEHLEEEANMYFDIFDMNKDGTIQREEFVSAIHHLLGSTADVDSTNFDQLFESINQSDSRSGLDREQFIKFYKTLLSGKYSV